MANDAVNKPFKTRDVLIAVASGGLAIALVLYFAGQWELEAHPLVGKPAPEIEYEIKTGKRASVTKQKGSTILINFWATWCSPCMEEMPSLSVLESHFAAKGLVLLAFNIEDHFGENLRAQIAGNRMPRNLIFNFSKEQLRPYNVQSIPLSVLIDQHGVIRKVYSGPRNWMNIGVLKDIEAVLKESN